MKALAYTRVSTEKQAKSELGLESQRAAILAHAKVMGVEVSEWFEDAGVSGAKGLDENGGLDLDQRPGLMSAMMQLGKGDVLIVARRDRLARDQILAMMLDDRAKRKGARIVSAAGEGTLDDSPTSKLIRAVMDATSEYNRAIIRMNIKAAAVAKKAKGEKWGNLAYGTMLVEGKVVPNTEEQAVIAYIRTMHSTGLGCRAIAARLNDEGVALAPKTRKGVPTSGKWMPTQVLRILSRA